MNKAVRQWERFLFSEHHLVALRSLNPDLQLLDILVKKGSHGLPVIGDRGPIIVRIGSILGLRSHDDNPEWEEWAKHAKDSLRRLQQNEELDELFSTGSIGDYESNTEIAFNMHWSLSTYAGIGGNRAKSWSGSALNVTYEKFTEDSAKNLFYADPVALWKPDLQRIKLEQPSIRRDGTLDLWVVNEIQYAKEIKISANSHYEAEGGVDLASVTGVPIPLPGGTLQVDAKVGKPKDGATEHVKGQKVPFAFKAIRLVYGQVGNLIAKHSDLGTKRPEVLACMLDDDEEDRVQLLDEEEDPPPFSMQMRIPLGLFAQAPGKGDDEEEGVQFLDEEEVRQVGNLIAKHSDLGTKRPMPQMSMQMPMKVDPSTFFNADKDPIYHMGGLFAQAPGQLLDEEDDDEEDRVQLLDAQAPGKGDDEEEGVQLLDVVTK